MRTLYLDLDGVLADLETAVNKLVPNPTTSWDWEHIRGYDKDLFLNLSPCYHAFTLWEEVREYFTPKILTAIPSQILWPEVTNHKRRWVKEYFGANVEVLFGPYAIDKQFHCKPGDILIDDNPMNISQWNSRGGHGILYKDPGEGFEINFRKVLRDGFDKT